MSNDLTKKTKITYSPEVISQAAIPYRPAIPGHWITQAATVCGFTTTWTRVDNSAAIRAQLAEMKAHPEIAGWPVLKDTYIPAGSYVCRDVVSTTYVPATPEQVARPAIAYHPAGTETDYMLGWNAGARSASSLTGGGTVSFQITSAVGVVAGLNDVDAGTIYTEIAHGIYGKSSAQNFKIMELGVEVFNGGYFEPADTFKITRVGTRVTYLRNDVLVYTSLTPSTGEVFLDASLYAGGDTISNPALVASDAVLVSSSGVMPPIRGIASDHAYAMSSAEMLPLAGQAGMLTHAAGAMRPLSGVASNKPYGESRGAMAALSGLAYSGVLIPDYALSSGQMFPLYGASIVLAGGIARAESIIHWLGGVASDHPYGESRGVMFPLVGQALGADVVVMPVIAPAGQMAAYMGASAKIKAPAGAVHASAHDSTGENGANLTAPLPALSAFMGAVARIMAAPATVEASATGENWLKADLTAPAGVVSADATVSGASQAAITAPMASAMGYAGMACAVTLGGCSSIMAEVTSGSISHASITAPLFKLIFSAISESHCSADLTAPAGRMGVTLQAWIVAPAGTLTAIVSAVVTASYEAYSVNLSHQGDQKTTPIDEVTRYTSFPFDRIVCYQNSYFGVAADGLYLLEGATDDGAEIAYAVKTCIDDFKAPELKTIASAYFGGRLGPGAKVTLFVGEAGQETYAYTTPRGQLAQNHREKFGRGVKNRYFALGLAGLGALELDMIELEINKMTRRI